MHQGVVLHLAYLTPIIGFGRARHSQPNKRDPSHIQFRVCVMHRLLDLCKGSFEVCNRISYRGVMAFIYFFYLKGRWLKGRSRITSNLFLYLQRKSCCTCRAWNTIKVLHFPPFLKRTELYP